MVRDGRIVAILNWDYAFTIYGLDDIDWETLGSRIPDL